MDPCLGILGQKMGPMFRDFFVEKPTHLGSTSPYNVSMGVPPGLSLKVHSNRGGTIGGQGGKSSPKDFQKKEKLKNMGYFHASKLLKWAFLSSLTRKYVLWKGFYHDISTKKASASGDLAPWPSPRGSAPWTPKAPLPPLMIYPGAAPAQQNSYCSHCAVTIQWWCGDYPLIY